MYNDDHCKCIFCFEDLEETLLDNEMCDCKFKYHDVCYSKWLLNKDKKCIICEKNIEFNSIYLEIESDINFEENNESNDSYESDNESYDDSESQLLITYNILNRQKCVRIKTLIMVIILLFLLYLTFYLLFYIPN